MYVIGGQQGHASFFADRYEMFEQPAIARPALQFAHEIATILE